jgi:hypothetical protein
MTEARTTTIQTRPNQRPWRDLSKLRLFLGLAFAPVLPIGLGSLILLMLESGFLWSGVGSVLAAAETWSMLVGTFYLILARRRGVIRRAHCLLLGAFLAFSLPAAVYVTSKAVDWAYGPPLTDDSADPSIDFDEDFHGPSDAGLMAIIGLFLIPFGTIGGWVFWRVGVRPAQPKEADVATVFD